MRVIKRLWWKIFGETEYYSIDFSRYESRRNFRGKPRWFTDELKDYLSLNKKENGKTN